MRVLKKSIRNAVAVLIVFILAIGSVLTMTASTAAAADPIITDFSKAGYREGSALPANGTVVDLTTKGVTANDGIDDTAAIQAAIDGLKGVSTSDNRYILQLPAGEINISDEIHVDVNGIIIKGKGADPGNGGTKIVFKPWRAYSVVDGEPQIDGKMWPGYAAFRVETRVKHANDQTYEGSINFHWLSGVKVRSAAPNETAGGTKGSNTVYLSSVSGFSVGDTVVVLGCNTDDFLTATYVNQADWRNEHMRSQMFKVTGVNSSAKTLTLDKPLEFDLPYSNEGLIEGTTWYSKVMKVTAVRDVGFQDFYFTSTLAGTPYENLCNAGDYNAAANPGGVGYRYQNAAPEYAIHGILFKWAENCWAKNVKMYMSASHPIVTEFVHHCTFDGNYLDGAWNKGKGGHGYFRLSKASDCLVVNNTANKIRHLAIQWSTNGSVIKNNTLTCDINFHGGWERNNWVEGNTSNVPYEHRSWTEAGPENETWWPIWWGSGPHAGGWSGASGFNNVLYNNNFRKQATPGGSMDVWTRYSNANVIRLGWDGSSWKHLTANGSIIQTWAGNENIDYTVSPNAGVTVGSSGTPVPTITPTPTATPTPNATPTPTATPTPGSSNLKVQYQCGDPTTPGDNAVKPFLKIVNNGASAVDLSTLKIRYWYTKDGTVGENFTVDYQGTLSSKSVITGSFADDARGHYFEVGFTSGAGILAAGGGNTGTMKLRANKTDWSSYSETDDYSYDSTKTAFADWDKVTLYRNGILIWGTEP